MAALGSLGIGGRRRLLAVIERLSDGDLQVRLAAVRILGDSGDVAAQRALFPVLRDGSLVVRRAAGMALEALGVSRKSQRQRVAVQVTDEQLAALVIERRFAEALLIHERDHPPATQFVTFGEGASHLGLDHGCVAHGRPEGRVEARASGRRGAQVIAVGDHHPRRLDQALDLGGVGLTQRRRVDEQRALAQVQVVAV